VITVRTLRQVQAEKELTRDYNGDRRLQPTHMRRFKRLEVKGFTCHCARCDAPSDDTRQFHDSKCHGRGAACHPLNNKDPLPVPTMVYTGVEYVEPHLLPCTVCQRSPPLEYQTRMFNLEHRWEDALRKLPATPAMPTYPSLLLPDASGKLSHRFEPEGMYRPNDVPGLLHKLVGLQYHVSHWTGFQLELHEAAQLLKRKLEARPVRHTLQELCCLMKLSRGCRVTPGADPGCCSW
jgi:hypothetical protein